MLVSLVKEGKLIRAEKGPTPLPARQFHIWQIVMFCLSALLQVPLEAEASKFAQLLAIPAFQIAAVALIAAAYLGRINHALPGPPAQTLQSLAGPTGPACGQFYGPGKLRFVLPCTQTHRRVVPNLVPASALVSHTLSVIFLLLFTEDDSLSSDRFTMGQAFSCSKNEEKMDGFGKVINLEFHTEEDLAAYKVKCDA